MIKMSEEKRAKIGAWGTLIYRTAMGIAVAIILKSIPIFIYDVAEWKKDIEERTLSSVEMRIDLERHMAIWTPEAQMEAFARLSNTEKAIRELRVADSLSVVDRKEMRELLAKIERNTRKK